MEKRKFYHPLSTFQKLCLHFSLLLLVCITFVFPSFFVLLKRSSAKQYLSSSSFKVSGMGRSSDGSTSCCYSLEPMFKSCKYYSCMGYTWTWILYQCLRERFVEGKNMTFIHIPTKYIGCCMDVFEHCCFGKMLAQNDVVTFHLQWWVYFYNHQIYQKLNRFSVPLLVSVSYC